MIRFSNSFRLAREITSKYLKNKNNQLNIDTFSLVTVPITDSFQINPALVPGNIPTETIFLTFSLFFCSSRTAAVT